MNGPHLPLDGLYQLGFTTTNLERATTLLGERYGITSWRRATPNPKMRTAHAYAGDSMIELIEPTGEAMSLYLDHMPGPDDIVRLHHLGRRITNAESWAALERGIAALGLDVPMGGSVMDGDLHYVYVDTRADLGIYSEYVWLRGKALSLYDDVPRN